MAEHQHPVAIVTGAGSGIGQATTMALSQAGYSVALIGRDGRKLAETAQRARLIAKPAAQMFPIICDITEEKACAGVVHEAIKRWGRIDAVANVAGVAPLMSLDKIKPADWRSCIDTNLSAIVYMTTAVWPEFRRRKSGVIVNVSSMASVDPFPEFSIYAAAKAGVNMFTRCTAQEAQAFGAKAVCVAPGAVNTPMLRALWDESKLPNDRTLAPSDVASVIVGCITGSRKFVSGETILLPSP